MCEDLSAFAPRRAKLCLKQQQAMLSTFQSVNSFSFCASSACTFDLKICNVTVTAHLQSRVVVM